MVAEELTHFYLQVSVCRPQTLRFHVLMRRLFPRFPSPSKSTTEGEPAVHDVSFQSSEGRINFASLIRFQRPTTPPPHTHLIPHFCLQLLRFIHLFLLFEICIKSMRQPKSSSFYSP